MVTTTKAALSIAEAKSLVRRCAEPVAVGGVKGAVRQASRRLGFPFTRTRDIWYGDAKRIDAIEMDRLRNEARNTEILVGIDALRTLATAGLPQSHPMLAELKAAINLLLANIGPSGSDMQYHD